MATNPPALAKQIPATGKVTPPSRTFLKNDFPFIRKASIELAICLAISAAMVSGSQYLLAKQRAKQSQGQSKRNEAQSKLTEAETEKREAQEFQPKYERLVARGFIGEEKRLDWVEGMKQIQENRKLLPISYEITPQQPIPIESIQTSQLELRGSAMTLDMNLLHEMDFFSFLQDLKTKGFYSLQSCTVRTTGANEILAVHLSANCKLVWLTLGSRAAETGETPPAPAK